MMGTPAHLLLPVNVGPRVNTTAPGTKTRSALSSHARSSTQPLRGASHIRASLTNTNTDGTGMCMDSRAIQESADAKKPDHKKLYGSLSGILSPSSNLASKPREEQKTPRNMLLHPDSHSASSSRRPSVAATTATTSSARSSTDNSRRSSIALPSRRISTSVPVGAESVPLTVRDALVGLIAASCQAQYDIDELNTQPTGRTAPLRRVGNEVKSLKMTAQLLHKFLRRLENGQLEHAERAKLVELDVLVGVLTASILTLSELEGRLENMVMQAEDMGLSLEEMCQRLSRSLTKDANRISMVEFTITRLLSVLQVSDPDEAPRHQAQANLAVTDMLQADMALAGRMQQLQDTSRGLALVPEQRRAELTSRPPPSYSVPSPRSNDELPNYYEALDDDSVAIQPRDWSIYSGLTLADIPTLSRINLPMILGEIKDGYFYTAEYADAVSERLNLLAETKSPQKSKALAQILLITEPSKDSRKTTDASDHGGGGLAHRLARKIAKSRLLGNPGA
ncbi:hypothetical protein QQS21_007914 [Conoideocrella luteorostrata]|uniref:Uncharacterized protein n=1 Tax=Conoideocrella luteorostrata TaxID=1105319 RepID=A0AAJ0CJY1_9HYPO|nr:hypothetical protein QQS21_007914 [Conoideocrella luteorostrata]